MWSRFDMKDAAGVLCAFIVVISYIGIGFMNVAVFLIAGRPIIFPDDWKSAMLSLASAALGFLIGKQATATASLVGGDAVITGPMKVATASARDIPDVPEEIVPSDPRAEQILRDRAPPPRPDPSEPFTRS